MQRARRFVVSDTTLDCKDTDNWTVNCTKNDGADYTAILVPTTAVKVPITTMRREAHVAGFESNDLLGPLTQADGSDHLWFVGC